MKLATTSATADVWLWGASGAVGRRVAPRLAASGVHFELLGRSPERLATVARGLPGAPTRVLDADGLVPALHRAAAAGAAPRVVVHTAGPFDTTAAPVIDACLELGIDYVDVSNEQQSVGATLARDDEARARGVCLVTGAGYGVAATECLVLALADGRPPASEVTVAAGPHLETLGPAVTRSALEGVATGGREFRDGVLVTTRLGHPIRPVPLPDGTTWRMAAVPTGDLHAARHATGAGDVVALSSEMPTGRVVSAALPALAAVLRRPRLRATALGLADRLRVTGPTGHAGDVAGHPSPASWSYARIRWGTTDVREGWLRLGPSYAFTAAVLGDVIGALLDGRAAPGATTPGALLGADLPLAHGGTFVGFDRVPV